jgi:acyl-[acyl carrier protein]--UDP-N-acetylglucosamine O-acyltransferase
MIQPLAYIHPQAKIADNVVIEPFVTIHKDVEIGEGTWVGSIRLLWMVPASVKIAVFSRAL